MSITSQVEVVTPAAAKALLARNKGNRPVRQARVQQYADAMRAGLWRVAQAILVDWDGVLLDGQHRLHAVVLYGQPVEFVVVRGASPEAYAVIDTGDKRTVAASIARRAYKEGVEQRCLRDVGAIAAAMIKRAGDGTPAELTHKAVEDFWWRHRLLIEEVHEATAPINYMNASERASFANAALLHGKALVFPLLARLASGVFASEYDPMNTLNRWMIKMHMRRSGRKTYAARHACYSAVVLAVSAALEGRELKFLKPNGQDYARPRAQDAQ